MTEGQTVGGAVRNHSTYSTLLISSITVATCAGLCWSIVYIALEKLSKNLVSFIIGYFEKRVQGNIGRAAM